MLKIGFHGDMFAAREHNIKGMFHFSLKFCVQLMCLLTDLVVNVIKRTSLKSVNFTFFPG